MSIEKEAKNRAKTFLLENGISKITLENILFIIEQQGFRLVEYSQNYMNDSAWEIIKQLNLEQYALSGKAFAYKKGTTKLLFLCDEMTANEKLYALAHEEGHILCGHLGAAFDGSSVEQEHLASEIAHYLINPPLSAKLLITIQERKKLLISIMSIIVCLVIAITGTMYISKQNSYYGEYYITENGSKYHKSDCMFIKGKTNTERLTEADYYSGAYKPCKVCLPE